jgi:hypothetical protein
MAVDEGLAELLREALAGEAGVVEKRMFGGLAFMLRGNMVCGTYRDRGMFRVGKGQAAEALGLPGTQVMAMGGRAMPGMVEALPGDGGRRGAGAAPGARAGLRGVAAGEVNWSACGARSLSRLWPVGGPPARAASGGDI